jgi:hypothetical protein
VENIVLRIKNGGSHRFRRLILPIYYRNFKPKYGLNTDEIRKTKIIVSLTSYPARFESIDLTIKSLFNQTVKPDKIILYLDETVNENKIGDNIHRMEKYGLEICKRPENIKPHKKYYYAFKEHPEDIVITVDDDVMYDRNLIKSLMKSYAKYPKFISARRVHKMLKDSSGILKPYNEWENECENAHEPSMQLIATGVGGVLYPPHSMADEIFNLNNIKKLCVCADDIWLKYMQILNGTPVAYVKSKYVRPVMSPGTQEKALMKTNVHQNSNDEYIRKMSHHYKINLAEYI